MSRIAGDLKEHFTRTPFRKAVLPQRAVEEFAKN
jgi:hypothetical protein